jgi:hypothetical protein
MAVFLRLIEAAILGDVDSRRGDLLGGHGGWHCPYVVVHGLIGFPLLVHRPYIDEYRPIRRLVSTYGPYLDTDAPAPAPCGGGDHGPYERGRPKRARTRMGHGYMRNERNVRWASDAERRVWGWNDRRTQQHDLRRIRLVGAMPA